jgi:hypothetical protein
MGIKVGSRIRFKKEEFIACIDNGFDFVKDRVYIVQEVTRGAGLVLLTLEMGTTNPMDNKGWPPYWFDLISFEKETVISRLP